MWFLFFNCLHTVAMWKLEAVTANVTVEPNAKYVKMAPEYIWICTDKGILYSRLETCHYGWLPCYHVTVFQMGGAICIHYCPSVWLIIKLRQLPTKLIRSYLSVIACQTWQSDNNTGFVSFNTFSSLASAPFSHTALPPEVFFGPYGW